jgi:Ca-activated chloride channel family protein
MRIFLAWLMAIGCGTDTSAPPTKPSSTTSHAVVQGGAQDIAEFRSIVARGEVPAPEVLDEVGFFAEHAVDLPPAACGEDVCLHPMLAVAPRFNGANWTMAFIAMNSSVDPATAPRPPVHVVFALDQSSALDGYRALLATDLRALTAELRPEDRVSILAMEDQATVLVEGAIPGSVELADAIGDFSVRRAVSSVDLYDGLATAARIAEREDTELARVFVVTNGAANVQGIRSTERFVSLVSASAKLGVSYSFIGAGGAYDSTLAHAIGDLGVGNVYYAESATDLDQILRVEAATTMIPLATDFRLRVVPAPGYRVGRVYGALRARRTIDGVELSNPALFLGHREGASDTTGGRRGGGGGLFVELLADLESDVGPGLPAYSIRAEWNASGGRAVVAERDVVNVLAPGQNPDGMWPSFSDPERGKPFMMLNMLLALRATVEIYSGGDCARALGVTEMMQRSIEGWQARYADPDIDADTTLLLDLRDNVRSQCDTATRTVTPIEPVAEPLGCMML